MNDGVGCCGELDFFFGRVGVQYNGCLHHIKVNRKKRYDTLRGGHDDLRFYVGNDQGHPVKRSRKLRLKMCNPTEAEDEKSNENEREGEQ